jgi:predicted nucleic acid-binding protein
MDDEDGLYISILSVYELQYGFSKAKGKLRENIKKSLQTAIGLPIIPLSLEGAAVFGELKNKYQACSRKDLERHNFDFMIASSAIAEGAIFISNDKIFKGLKKLRKGFQLENWAAK